MIVITYSFSETEGIRRMKKSVQDQGYELAMVKVQNYNPALILKELFECYKRAATGHDHIIYADAADSYFQRKVNVSDYVLYSTEKACFPFPDWADKFNSESRWKYLNGGGYMGPSKLIVDFFSRYKLYDIGSRNPQAAQMEAYFQAVQDGFPIHLDTGCSEFQTIAFESPDEFEMKNGVLYNRITKTIPAVLHGNGLTPLEKFIL